MSHGFLWLCAIMLSQTTQLQPTHGAGSSRPWFVSPQPDLTIGVLEGEPEYILTGVSGAVVSAAGEIVVSVSRDHEVRVFSSGGSYRRSFGREGQGPGEFGPYSSMRPFRMSDGAVVFGDEMGRRFNVFRTDGELVRTRNYRLPLELDGSSWIEDVEPESGAMLIATAIGGMVGKPGELIQTEFRYVLGDSTGAFLREVAALRSSKRVVNEVAGATNYPFLPFTDQDRIRFASSDGFFVLTQEGELSWRSMRGGTSRPIDWDPPRIEITSAVWARYRREELASIQREQSRRQYEAFFARDLPIPDLAPKAQGMLLDRQGNLWIERYRLPWDEATIFDVIDRKDGWIATVRMPAPTTVFDVGADWILGRQVENGVERVVRYRLERRS